MDPQSASFFVWAIGFILHFLIVSAVTGEDDTVVGVASMLWPIALIFYARQWHPADTVRSQNPHLVFAGTVRVLLLRPDQEPVCRRSWRSQHRASPCSPACQSCIAGVSRTEKPMVKGCTAQMDRTLHAAELLDEVKDYVVSHRLDLTDGRATVTLADGEDFILGHVNADEEKGTRAHFELWNERRALSFESVDELRGWLRCHRSTHGAASRLARENLREVVRRLRTAFAPSDFERGADGSLLITVGDDGLDALDRLAVLADVE